LVEKLSEGEDVGPKGGVEEDSAKAVSMTQAAPVRLDKIVPLGEVSGSMSGTPMDVAIALGILVSEVNHPAFRDRVMTFHSDPSWVNLDGAKTIADKVNIVAGAPWGMNTDVLKAFELIAQVVKEQRLRKEEIPDLIIFSDMQFDEATASDDYGYRSNLFNPRKTIHEHIIDLFAEVGFDVSGEAYPAPRIVYWNLRGDTTGFPVQADAENVQMLSGFSPSLLELVMCGEALPVPDPNLDSKDDVEAGVEAEAAPSRPKVNPYQTFRAAMDKEVYDPVREALSKSREGVLKDYHFTSKSISIDQ
jgi:hypothetical protein